MNAVDALGAAEFPLFARRSVISLSISASIWCSTSSDSL
jgi:hypothetical protein